MRAVYKLHSCFATMSLGELEDEGYVKLGRGKVISKTDLSNTPGIYPVYSSAQQNDGKFGEYGEYMFDEELITWSVDGGGRLFYRPKHKFSVTNVGGTLRITKPDRINCQFLFYMLDYLHSTVKFDWVQKAHPSVVRKVYDKIPLVPLDEQRRIAEVLRSVDEAIAAKHATLAATKRFKRTCREAAVLRFLDCPSTKLKNVLASIDAGWSPDCESEPANDGEWSILKTSSVVWEGYNDSENKRLPAHLEPRPHLEAATNDILITRAGPAERTGVVAIVRETAGRRMLSDKIIRLRVDTEKAVPLAIAEMLSSDHVQAELVRSKTGMAASQTNISQKIVLGLEISLPSLAEQKDFADEMAALQDAIEVSETDLHDAQRLKSAIMSDLLSGRVQVPA